MATTFLPAVSIRPLTREDQPFLWSMLYQALHIPQGGDPPSPEIMKRPELRRYIQAWGQPEDMGFVATDGVLNRPGGRNAPADPSDAFRRPQTPFSLPQRSSRQSGTPSLRSPGLRADKRQRRLFDDGKSLPRPGCITAEGGRHGPAGSACGRDPSARY